MLDEFIRYQLDPCLFLCKFGYTVRNQANNYIKIFKKNHHSILNDHETSDEMQYEDQQMNEAQKCHNTLDYYLSFCKNDYEKNLLILKSQGYSNLEVAKKLHVKTKKIENDLYVIRKNIRNNEIYI